MPAFETVRLAVITTVLDASHRLQSPLSGVERQAVMASLDDAVDTLRKASSEGVVADADDCLERQWYRNEVVTLDNRLAPRAFETVAHAIASEYITARPIALLTYVIHQLKEDVA